MERNVFVTNRSCHDFSTAERFGKLCFITEGPIQRLKTSVMYRYIWKALRGSAPEDYLLVTGMTIMNMVAASIMGHLHGRLNLLLYDPERRDKYVERSIIIKKGEEDVKRDLSLT